MEDYNNPTAARKVNEISTRNAFLIQQILTWVMDIAHYTIFKTDFTTYTCRMNCKYFTEYRE